VSTGDIGSVVEPKPAASVILVRRAREEPASLEAYVIRRQRSMRFLGGYYAFPGGKVDPEDAGAAMLARLRGVDARTASATFASVNGLPALAYWATAIRELLEECGILVACDARGRPVDARVPRVAEAIERCRADLMAGVAPFAELLARRRWYADARALAYLSHFVTPRRSPIRFSARFFVCVVPSGQAPRLFTEETSEAFWIRPGEAYRRFLEGAMAMAEPAEYALGYLAQFRSIAELGGACGDGCEKFHGIADRLDVAWDRIDWKANRWPDATFTRE
jgi:8-oxo-dGTP pyrophosphatase MutT (NUDIX family)